MPSIPRIPRIARRRPRRATPTDTTELGAPIAPDAPTRAQPPVPTPGQGAVEATAAPARTVAPPATGPEQQASEAPAVYGPAHAPPPGAQSGPPTAGELPAPVTATEETAESSSEPSFRERGRMRRRLRYLRRVRELAFRDLGGLVFDLHRFGRAREDLVVAKLDRLADIDTELRALEVALDDRHDVLVLREAGVSACPRCGCLHGTDANFCPNCALPVQRGAELPVGGTVAGPATAGPTPPSASEPRGVETDAPAVAPPSGRS